MKHKFAIAILLTVFSGLAAGESIKEFCAYKPDKFPLVFNFTESDKKNDFYEVKIDKFDEEVTLQFKSCQTFKSEIIGKDLFEYRGKLCLGDKVLCINSAYIKKEIPQYYTYTQKSTFFQGLKFEYNIESPNKEKYPNLNKIVFNYKCIYENQKTLEKLSGEVNNDKSVITIWADTRSGCPKIESSFVNKFMDKFSAFFGIVFISIGAFFCFFGVKTIRVTVFLIGFIFMFVLALVISFAFATINSDIKPSTGWIIVGVSFALALLAGWILMKCIPVALLFLGALCGIILAFFLNSLFISRIDVEPEHLLLIILLVVLAIIGGFIGYKFREEIIIIGTGISGSYLIIKALGLMIGGLPAETELAAKLKTNDPDLKNGAIYGYLSGFVVLAVLGIYIQFKYFKKDSEKTNEEDHHYAKI